MVHKIGKGGTAGTGHPKGDPGNRPIKPPPEEEEENEESSPPPVNFAGGDPFASARSVTLPSEADIDQGFNDALERGQAFLQSLGTEGFVDLISSAMATKFDVPDNVLQLIEGQGAEPVTAASSFPQFNPSSVGVPARQALQRGISTLPPPGGGQNNA